MKKRLILLVLIGVAGCLVAAGTSLAFVRPEAASKVFKRTLTFTDRVAYQRGIEEVYWRHRIWPKDRPDPKPPLDIVMPQAQLEKKVADYLGRSRELERWGRPITAEQLQAEMDRMAEYSKQPEVLRELFATLGNDPVMIAECLARPALAERLVTSLDDRQIKTGVLMPQVMAATSVKYTLPTVSNGSNGFTDDTWTATGTTNAPSNRYLHTTVWTGSEMIIWGGFDNSSLVNTGGRYNPSTDTWTTTSTTNAPSGRRGHMAIWTGIEMIVWGGGNWDPINTGGRYNPGTDSWTATSTTNAPSARVGHTLVWTGNEMIVWGGTDINANVNTGGKYDPDTDQWKATTMNNAPSPRICHTAVWSGSEMIVWGGLDYPDNLDTGGKYNPSLDTWTAISTTNAPAGRSRHTAVWIGNEMIVWGGFIWDEHGTLLNTGGKYNPSTDSWVDTSTANVPTAREFHSTVWTGSEMIVWGGYDNHNFIELNTGGRYDPSTDTWTATSMTNAPTARDYHTTVWTGREMIVWGGYDRGNVLNTGVNYCPQSSAPILQSAVSRKTHGSASSFDINLPLNGTAGVECRSGGATSDYTIVLTFLANVLVNASPQAAITSGTGTIGSGGVSNGGMVITSGNVVTIPLTNVVNAQTINVTLNNVNGSTNVTIPMGVLIGDVNGNGAVNASDIALTKSRSGQPVAAATFRSDMNADGSINAADVSFVKSLAGTGLP